MIHRDIKPQNLLLKRASAPGEAASGGAERSWEVKIADFGLSARMASSEERRLRRTTNHEPRPTPHAKSISFTPQERRRP